MSARDLRGLLAVAATYVYFLIFAQYGFLRLLESRLDSAASLKSVMAAMGLAGLGVSLAAGRWLAILPAARLLRAGFAGSAATALFAIVARGTAAHVVVALLIGSCTALTTVALAAELRALVAGPAFALKIGIATGLGYLFCNVPPVFSGDPVLQCVLAAAAAAAGLAAVPTSAASQRSAPEGAALADGDYHGVGFVTIVLSFLTLVWLDSAVFSIIQQTPDLKALTWQGVSQKWLLGATHFAAAAAAGWLIDRGRFRSLLLTTFVLFVAGFGLLGGAESWHLAGGSLYVTGVSIYSVALVVYPSYLGERASRVATRWRAALLYGVAGWLGSALGIGMAENQHRIPRLFVVAAGGLLLVAWVLAVRPHLRGFLVRLGRAHRITTTWLLAGVVVYIVAPGLSVPPAPAARAGRDRLADLAAPERGRAVYIAEGCINCHSQYVRPGTHDVEWWGPYREPDQRPVLIGNRRQGPDLLNVGLRRNEEWQRLHLIDPRSVSPGSRMPSYDHLFAAGERRGDDLVAYLESLGASRVAERDAYVRTWNASTHAVSGQRGAELFDQLCSPCHGVTAQGDGPVGRQIGRPAMDLLKDHFWLISWGGGAEPEPDALARVVKFGVGGTTMPGHETLSSQEVADIVDYLRQMRAARSTAKHAEGGSERSSG